MDTLNTLWDALASYGIDEPEQLRCYFTLEKLDDEELVEYLHYLVKGIESNGVDQYIED